MSREEPMETIERLLSEQRLGVLSTQGGGRSHASLVAFAVTGDLRSVVFATSRATRKYANCQQSEEVALLVDDRVNAEVDFHQAAAVSVYGLAAEVPADQTEALERLFLDRHPYLTDFVSAPTCALMRIQVDRFSLVTRFQEVTEVDVSP